MSDDFLFILSPADRDGYGQLRARILESNNKVTTKNRVEALEDTLDELKRFCLRGDEDDWKRCVAIGMFWIDDMFVINIRRLIYIIGKCKSSINGGVSKMGYVGSVAAVNDPIAAIKKFPGVRIEIIKQREWSVRKKEGARKGVETTTAAVAVVAELSEFGDECCENPQQWMLDNHIASDSSDEAL